MQQQKAGTSTVKTVCSYCGVGCGMVLDVGDRARDGRAHGAQGVRRQGPSGQLRPAVHQGRDQRRHARRAGPAGDRAGARRARGGSPARSPWTRRSAETARRLRAIIDEHGPGRRRVLRLRADDAWRRSTWRTSWPRASSAPTRSSRTRGCAWPARAPATSCRSAPTARPARTRTSTTPTCSSSSARTWPTATRSCSCG